MSIRFTSKWIVAAMVFTLSSGMLSLQALPGGVDTTVSVSGDADSYSPILSADGRFVAFSSAANNLALAGTNTLLTAYPSILNVYLRDRASNTTLLVSIDQYGSGSGNSHSMPVALSDDGRYVLFESTASNLVPGDTNNANDIFVRDTLLGITQLVSANANGYAGNKRSFGCSMSANARYVAFASEATDLVANDTNGISDIFVRDLQTGVTRLASVGAQATLNGKSERPIITPDGRYVAFLSNAKNLVPKGQGAEDVYVRDMVTGRTFLASTNASSGAFGASTSSSQPCISDDGRFVAFDSYNSSPGAFLYRQDLQTGTANKRAEGSNTSAGNQTLDMTPDGRFIVDVLTNDIYVWDTQQATTTLVTATVNSQPAKSPCDKIVISKTGRLVAFYSAATNLTADAVSSGFHPFVRDVQAGTTRLLGGAANGAVDAMGSASVPAFSADGRWVAFDSMADNLVPGDANHRSDVFVEDLTTGAIELISCALPDSPVLAGARNQVGATIAVNADGRFAAFSAVSDLSPYRNLFVHDFLLGTNLLASIATNGLPADSHASEPSISADGRFVAFSSKADNLISGDTNGVQDVFVRDLRQSTTALVSCSTNGSAGSAASRSPIISQDGQKVLFYSSAKDLALIVNSENLFWRDLKSQATCAVTTNGVGFATMTPDGRFVAFAVPPRQIAVWDSQTATVVWTAESASPTLAISSDGLTIAHTSDIYSGNITITNRLTSESWIIQGSAFQFSSSAPTLVFQAGLFPKPRQVFEANYQTREIRLISKAWDTGDSANSLSRSSVINADGRFVAFVSAATNLVPADLNHGENVFLVDTVTDTATLLSASLYRNAAANFYSFSPVFSGDGKSLVYRTWASDLGSEPAGGLVKVNLTSTNSASFSVSQIAYLPASSGKPLLRWPATPGKQYQVEFTGNLTHPAWQNLDGRATVVGSAGYATDVSPASSNRFYRIKGLNPE